MGFTCLCAYQGYEEFCFKVPGGEPFMQGSHIQSQGVWGKYVWRSETTYLGDLGVEVI